MHFPYVFEMTRFLVIVIEKTLLMEKSMPLFLKKKLELEFFLMIFPCIGGKVTVIISLFHYVPA
jgi:hypothetical protein